MVFKKHARKSFWKEQEEKDKKKKENPDGSDSDYDPFPTYKKALKKTNSENKKGPAEITVKKEKMDGSNQQLQLSSIPSNIPPLAPIVPQLSQFSVDIPQLSQSMSSQSIPPLAPIQSNTRPPPLISNNGPPP
eukprot:UN23853